MVNRSPEVILPRKRGRPRSDPCPQSRLRKATRLLRVDDENNVTADFKPRTGEGVAKIYRLSGESHDAMLNQPQLPTDLKRAIADIPVNRADDHTDPKFPSRYVGNHTNTDSMHDSDDEVISGLPVAPNVRQVIHLDGIPHTKMNLRGTYLNAVKAHGTRGYPLVMPSPTIDFFLAQPARILIAVFPPELIYSIIDNTNRYIEAFRKDDIQPLTIIDFWEYLLVLLECHGNEFPAIPIQYRHKDTNPMSYYRFRCITRALQLTENFFLGSTDNTTNYNGERVMVDTIMKVAEMFSRWTLTLVDSFTTAVIDETRIPNEQRPPMTTRKNPIPNYSASKPKHNALQMFTLHDGQTLMLLNFAPTVSGFIEKCNQPRPFGRQTITPTAVVNCLTEPLPQGTKEHQIVFVMDGYFGSSQAARLVADKNHHFVGAINRNTAGLPQSICVGLPCGHNEYVSIAITLSEDGQAYHYYLSRSGSRHPNTTLSSFFYDKIIGRFKVQRSRDGVFVHVDLIPIHAIYKMIANSADMFNQRLANLGTHTLHTHRTFKTKLIHHLFGMMFVQTQLAYNHAIAIDGLREYPFPFKNFWQFLAWSLRYMLYIEHHYPVGVQFYVSQVDQKDAFAKGDLAQFCHPPGKGNTSRTGHPCNYAKKGFTHPLAYDICLPCLLFHVLGHMAYVCPPCRDQKHSRYQLTTIKLRDDYELVTRELSNRKEMDQARYKELIRREDSRR